MSEFKESTIGIDEINYALEKLYGEQEGFCYGTQIPYFLGGNDPLDMVQIFESNSGGIPHWHYITCGFTELYGKESNNKDISGYGFELTFRLKKNEDKPPVWPINLLQNIARYVFSTGNIFEPGHHMNANGPIQLGYNTEITAFAFIREPELLPVKSENGDFEFIEMVGITNDEMEAAMCWDCEKLIKVFDRFIPLGITDLNRKSLMDNETVYTAFEKGVDSDGSSTAFILSDCVSLAVKEQGKTKIYGIEPDKEAVELLKDNNCAICIGAGHIRNIITILKGRLIKNRNFKIHGQKNNFFFKLDKKCSVCIDNNSDVIICLTGEAVNEMSQELHPKAGIYELKSMDIKIILTVTEIKDLNGNIVNRIG